MAGFRIISVTARSKERGDVSLTFGPGLNIIQGRSDSGKTCVANCIDFAFGGATEQPFKETARYESVTLVVAPNDADGEVILSRTVGKNQISVVSTVAGIDTDTYDVNYRKGAKNPCINLVWLKLIGLDGETMVNANLRFEKKRLTWKNLLRIFYLDEDRIDNKESIVEPKSKYNENTLFLSCLLYLLTAKAYTATDAQEKAELKKARRKAVADYVTRKMSDASDRKKQLEAELKIYEPADVEKGLSEAMEALHEIQGRISIALQESDQLLTNIMAAEQRLVECDVLLGRYHRLSSQYKADIRRLSLIVEGEQAYQLIPESTICPYCEGTIKPQKRESYIASSKVELERTMAQLNGLGDTISDVESRQTEISKELEKLKEQRDTLQAHVKRDLRPQEDSLMNEINAYKAYQRIASEIDLITTYSKEYDDDLVALDLEKKNEQKIEFRPKEYFGDDFITVMSEYAESILKECKYAGLISAHLDFSKFDIVINGEPKETSHGKGYRSYINTVMIMMLRKYISQHAIYDPHIFIVDTPLHGFDEAANDKMPDSMRAGLYRYFMNHQDEGQLIIIENLDHIPHLDFAASGATVVTFEKEVGPGKRYGFLNITD